MRNTAKKALSSVHIAFKHIIIVKNISLNNHSKTARSPSWSVSQWVQSIVTITSYYKPEVPAFAVPISFSPLIHLQAFHWHGWRFLFRRQETLIVRLPVEDSKRYQMQWTNSSASSKNTFTDPHSFVDNSTPSTTSPQIPEWKQLVLIELKRRRFIPRTLIFLTAWGISRMPTTNALYINVLCKHRENETQHWWRSKVKYM